MSETEKKAFETVIDYVEQIMVGNVLTETDNTDLKQLKQWLELIIKVNKADKIGGGE